MSREVGAEKKIKRLIKQIGDQLSVRESLVLTFFNVSHLSNTHYLGLWNPQMMPLKVEFLERRGLSHLPREESRFMQAAGISETPPLLADGKAPR